MESRRDRVIEGSCGFCLFGAAPGPIRPLPMMDPDIVPDFCLFGSFARFSFAAARRAWKACGQSLFAPFLGFAFGARIDHASHTLRCRRPVPVRRFPFRNSPAGLLINNFFFGVGPWKCGQSFPSLSAVPRSGHGLPTFPQPHPASALGPRSVIRFAAPRAGGICTRRWRSRRACGRRR